MAVMETPQELSVAELEQQLADCEAEHERLTAEAQECHRRACRLRVQLAKARSDAPDAARTYKPLRVRIREFAMHTETFTEDELSEQLAVPKAKLRPILDELAETDQLARMRRGRVFIFSWIRPDHDSAPRPRREAENFASRQRGDTVAGTGRSKLSGRKDVDRLARKAARGGATVTKLGNDHIEITNEHGRITMSSTPRGSGMNRTKKELRDVLNID